MKTLETERLLIRNFVLEDWKELHEYLSQQEVLKYEPEDASSIEDCRLKAIERSKGDIFWAVCIKETGRLIGHIYFNQTEPVIFSTWEIGYIFNPEYYGRGYATEASRRILQYGFEELNAHRIKANCNPENTPSWKLLERLKMRREGHFLQKAFFRRKPDGTPDWFNAFEYAIIKDEWNEMNK